MIKRDLDLGRRQKGDSVAVDLAVHDLEKGLSELRELMDRLRRVVWRSRLKSDEGIKPDFVKPYRVASDTLIEEETLQGNPKARRHDKPKS